MALTVDPPAFETLPSGIPSETAIHRFQHEQTDRDYAVTVSMTQLGNRKGTVIGFRVLHSAGCLCRVLRRKNTSAELEANVPIDSFSCIPSKDDVRIQSGVILYFVFFRFFNVPPVVYFFVGNPFLCEYSASAWKWYSDNHKKMAKQEKEIKTNDGRKRKMITEPILSWAQRRNW